MRKIIVVILMFVAVLLPGAVKSETSKKHFKYRIGLVLSGGGAKGFAHIGVLKVLERENVKVDIIGGTSMGSIVGGLYAAGYTPQQMEDLVMSQNWRGLFSDSVNRIYVPVEEKNMTERYVLQLPVISRKIKLPSGLIQGHNIQLLFSELCWEWFGLKDFSELRKPFYCIATDAENGESVKISSGDLSDAMRASMAIPSVFTPVTLNNRLLVDGGVVNNFPVKTMKDYGAEIIIGVDVGAALYKRDELDSFVKILEQTVNFYGASMNFENRKLCDLLIMPDIKGFNAGSFDKKSIEELIKRGERAALLMIEKIRALKSDTDFDKSGYSNTGNAVVVKDVIVNGLIHTKKSVFLSKAGLVPPVLLTPQILKRKIQRAYSTGIYSKITYSFKERNRKTLVLNVHEMPQAKFFAGFRYNSRYKSGLLLAGEKRNLLKAGSVMRVEAEFSQNPGVKGEFYIDRGILPGLGLDFKFRKFRLPQYSDKVMTGKLIRSELNVRASLISRYSPNFNLYTNFEFASFDAEPEYETPDFVRGREDFIAFNAGFEADTLNKKYFPDRGFKLIFNYKALRKTGKENKEIFHQLNGAFSGVMSLCRKLSAGGSVEFAYTSDKTPEMCRFYLGGAYTREERHFSIEGMRFAELSGNTLYKAELFLRHNFLNELFLTFKYQMAAASLKSSEIFKAGINNSFGLRLTYMSFFGPIEVGCAISDYYKKPLFYLQAGYDF